MIEQADAPKKEKKGPPPDLKIPPKKPKLTKAERRALQEQQRAAKTANQQGGPQQQQQQEQQQESKGDGGQKENASKQQQPQQPSSNSKKEEAKASDKETSLVDDKTMDLFSHLPQYRGRQPKKFKTVQWDPFLSHLSCLHSIDLPNPHSYELTSTLHPDVIELGMQYASGEIRGENSRCRAMLKVFLQVLEDYQPPQDLSDYRSHFDHDVLKPSFTYWTTRCRPHSVSMGNAFTFLKTAVASLDRESPWEEAKEILQDTIERFMQERIELADQAIAQHALQKIEDGDVILTYGNSQAISVLLRTAKEKNTKFYVWVVDSGPCWEGKNMLAILREADIPCGYILLNALTYVTQQVTKVFLGASALMSNGCIYAPNGTACVALLAEDHHIPVLVCCETYKISNKVVLESITHNELGNPDSLIHGDSLIDWKETPNLKLLHLLYDVTPAKFVTGIVTEVGIIPPSSVAVLLREMNPQDAEYSY